MLLCSNAVLLIRLAAPGKLLLGHAGIVGRGGNDYQPAG